MWMAMAQKYRGYGQQIVGGLTMQPHGMRFGVAVFKQLGVGCGEVAVLSRHVLRGFGHVSWFADLDTTLSKEVW